jgi:hypothetical protein
MCSGEVRTLTGLPGGGDFALISGPANLVGNQLTSLAAGTIVISYEVDNNGCIGFVTESIVSHQTPSPSIIAMEEMCENQTQVLSGQPAGGIFSIALGPGSLNGNVLTATGFGIISVNYSIVQNGCEAETTAHIIAIIEPTPVITSSDDTLCTGDPRMLTGMPAGGNFTVLAGAAFISNQVLTATAGGSILIEYAVTANGCTGRVQQAIEAIQSPVPVFTSDDSPMCFNETRVLEAMPPGGVFSIASGPGALNGNTLSPTGSGIITLHYTVAGNGCIAVAFQEIGVSIGELPMITSDILPLCSGTSRILSGTPIGGVFSVLSGPGIIQDSVLVAVAGGDIVVEYETCAGAVSQTIAVIQSPQPIITSSAEPMCVGDTRELQTSLPGGLFSVINGPGVLQGEILSVQGTGLIELAYTVTQNGCPGADTQFISAVMQPIVEIVQDQNSINATLDTGMFQWVDCDLGFLAVSGETGNSFVPQESGNYALVYSNSACTDTTDCISFIISNIHDLSKNGLTAYPNPASEMIHVETTGNKIQRIYLLDLLGTLWLELPGSATFIKDVDISGLPAGSYTILIVDTRGIPHIARFVKLLP